MPRKKVKKVSVEEISDKLEKTTCETIDADKAIAEAVEWVRESRSSQMREGYGDSVVELRKATEKLTIDQIEDEIKKDKKKTNAS